MTDAKEIYHHLRHKPTIYNEEVHCPLIIKVMMDPEKGTVAHFCCDALVSDWVFHKWIANHELFGHAYYLAKQFARVNWEKEGRRLKDEILRVGQISNAFEYWKMIGWSRFGVSNKNARVRLELNPDDDPSKHYAQLIRQAASGDFTAGEIKQLMEAVNVGLNTHQVFALQKQIDELKSDLVTMNANANVQNTFSNTRSTETD